jgi:DNA-binding SARP family transcriptional activator
MTGPIVLSLALAPTLRAGAGGTIALALPDAALLAWLAIEGPTPRERLAALLWPQATAASAARNALRQRLHRLRRQTGCELVGGSTMLALAAGVAHDLEGAVTLLGDARSGAEELDAWLVRQRQQRTHARRAAMLARVDALEAAGELDAALPLLRNALADDPLSEDLHRRLMRAHYLRGDRAAALLAFDECERMLKNEVGAAPSVATLALLRSIEEQAVAGAPAAARAVPAALLRPPRLVGRQATRRALAQAFDAATLVLVTGEAGIGKSRLLQQLATDEQGIVIVNARPGDRLTPYATFARLLHMLAERAPAALDERSRKQLAVLLPEATPPPRAPGRESLVAPVMSFLRRSAAVLAGAVLDDLQFADDATLALLQSLLAAPRGEQPLRFALGSRPAASGSALAALIDALAQAAPLLRIPLPPLTEAEIAELVDSLALPGPSGAEIAGPLRQRSGGNPLFLLETLKLAWSEGTLEAAGALPRPQSLTQLIGEQLARLTPAALMLARMAAIAGVDFSLALAEQVLGQSALELADPWAELEARHVFAGAGFAHDLFEEALVAAVPEVIAGHLHGKIARALEAAGSEPARVAAHWQAAGEPARALAPLRAAADRAHLALREQEAGDFLLRAADIALALGSRHEAFDLVARAVAGLLNSADPASGVALLDRLDLLADQPAQRARALGLRAWYCTLLANEAQAVQHGEQALALARGLSDQALATQIRQRLATALAMLGRFDDALPHLQAALPHADRLLPPEDRAEFHGNFAVVLDNLGRPDEAARYRERAIEAAREAGDHAQQVSHLANQAVSRINAGAVHTARKLIDQAQRLIASYEMQGSTVGFVAVLQMQSERAVGRYTQALAAGEHALAVLGQSNPARLPVVQIHFAHAWLDLGQTARAAQALTQAAAGEALPPHFEARRLLLWSRCERSFGRDSAPALAQAAAAAPRQGWPEVALLVEIETAGQQPGAEARARLEAAALRAAKLHLRGAQLAALLRLCDLSAQSRHADAAVHARRALALARTAEPALMQHADVWLCCGRAYAAAGQAEAARAAFASGAAWARRCAAEQVPPPFVESFLQRNATVRDLLAAAAA